MKLSEAYNSVATAQIACRDNHNCESDNKHTAKGDGHYEQKAYNPTITMVCEFGEMALRIVKAYDTKYEILCDGTLLNRYTTFKIAERYFMDFTGLTPAKYKKIAKAVTA